MNNGAPQPVQSANVGTQPSLPEPQQPGFMNSDPADITFVIDEASGQLMMAPKSIPTHQPSGTNETAVDQTDIRFQSAVEEASTQRPVEPNPLDERMGKMENMMQQMGMLLQGLMTGKGLSNLSQDQVQETEETSLDLNELDAPGLIRLIKGAVDSAINTRMAPMQQTQSELIMRQQFNDAAYKYGQDFITLTPALVELKKSDPNISWETAYQAIAMGAKLLNGKKSTNSDSTIQTANGSQRQPQAAQTLIDRAAKLSTETNGTPRVIVDQQQRITSVSSAFDKAWQDLMG